MKNLKDALRFLKARLGDSERQQINRAKERAESLKLLNDSETVNGDICPICEGQGSMYGQTP